MSDLALARGLSVPTEAVARIAWAAGLFEGEGCIVFNKVKACRRLTLVSTDLDVLEKFQRAVGAGNIRSRRVYGNRKPCWIWGVSRWPDVERTLKVFLPYFGRRRAAKARLVLANPKVRGMGVCPKCGNRLVGKDADVYVWRDKHQCAPCQRVRSRRNHHARKKRNAA